MVCSFVTAHDIAVPYKVHVFKLNLVSVLAEIAVRLFSQGVEFTKPQQDIKNCKKFLGVIWG
jgi:hypothetical protein